MSAVVEVDGLVKTFGRFAAVDGLDLHVGAGEVHGFLGPNGAGKSTTIRVLLGLYRATAGRVRVLGLDPARRPAELTRRISYVPGDVALWPTLTGQEVLDALAALRGTRDRAAERRLVDAFALDTRRQVRTYSKGNRQKVVLVAAFAARTELLVLDEPTTGLDPLMEELFQRCVREAVAQGRTVLLSSHVLAEVEALCEAVTIVKDGRLVESGPVAQMRLLGGSQVTATVAPEQAVAVAAGLRRAGIADPGPGPDLRLDVPRAQVPAVLSALAGGGALDITCTPTRLEDLFRRHYEVRAR
ncbi:ABC transporter ATP-binding protein [Cellulomonas fengjieae]|uniref:ABC transporter ATP-binding protein n=1 Tax=Cellulomonas fengjieae TaxID=2819978 RepID=A0ABS3SKK6_9CELL|nr:ABC transporter ATP-binding protein [Cellulomonas fengjieae]MBO3086263.1 ABC transporter ATP-binding protein [Cellulomonas fengjieae]MBO3102331.1 ABC transporter ATP-binding protein [Cellulomonas fengjieae]QVI65692.1 ABC transporter ATP-binding protein [Cellulomonas fengjieae]